MKDVDKVFKTGTHLSLSVNTPCGYSFIEGGVVAKASNGSINLVFSAGANPKLCHIPVGTQVSLQAEIGSEVFAYNGIISGHEDRPYLKVKVFQRLPALEKREYRRISVNIPMHCSVIDESGSFNVIHDGTKTNGRHTPAEISLSAGGFKVKTPFQVKKDSMAIAVFIYPDESERVVPVISTSVYSYPAPSSHNYLSGFKFSLISDNDREKIGELVNNLYCTRDPAHRTMKYPSCINRIRKHA
jgi:hypothetical protein